MEGALEGLKEGRVPSPQQLGSFADIQAAVGFPVSSAVGGRIDCFQISWYNGCPDPYPRQEYYREEARYAIPLAGPSRSGASSIANEAPSKEAADESASFSRSEAPSSTPTPQPVPEAIEADAVFEAGEWICAVNLIALGPCFVLYYDLNIGQTFFALVKDLLTINLNKQVLPLSFLHQALSQRRGREGMARIGGANSSESRSAMLKQVRSKGNTLVKAEMPIHE